LARSRLPLPLGSFDAPLSLVSVQNVASAVSFALSRQSLSGLFSLADPGTSSLCEVVREYRLALRRNPMLLNIPDLLLRKLARLLGQQRLYETMSVSELAAPTGLLDAGWRPFHSSSLEGVGDWARRSATKNVSNFVT
jgi:NAD dependent epimerase/dehydratase family enzyme